MLYELWRQTARQGGRELALTDLSTGRAWSFTELLAESECGPRPDSLVAFPQGGGASFVLEVVRAWRWEQVVCPLEAGQAPPPQLAGAVQRQDGRFDLRGCVHLKLTSATTGGPRMIAFTAEQLAADARNIMATMGLSPDCPNLGLISLAHSYGFSNLVLPLLLYRIPLMLGLAGLPETLRSASTLAPAFTLPAVPALWRAWHEARAIPNNVLLGISAGAPLPLPLEIAIYEASGLKIHNFYGASECGGIAYDRTAVPRSDTSCVGSPMEGAVLARLESGCLEVRGPAVGQTYWPVPGPELEDGRFVTSDLVELREGLVFLSGRASDMINVAGRKVSPETIERALLSHDRVRECIVVGAAASQSERGEIVVAYVVSRGQVTQAELKQHLLERLPAWQVPREWHFIPEILVNERGKLSRVKWRELTRASTKRPRQK